MSCKEFRGPDPKSPPLEIPAFAGPGFPRLVTSGYLPSCPAAIYSNSVYMQTTAQITSVWGRCVMQKVTIASLVFLAHCFAAGQSADTSGADSLAADFLDRPAPLTILHNGRHQIYRALMEGNDRDVSVILKEMQTRIDTSAYNLLTPYERVGLDAILKRFVFIRNLSLIDSLPYYYSRKAPAPGDALARKMKDILTARHNDIIDGADDLSGEQTAFLDLFLVWLAHDSARSNDDALNEQANAFLAAYSGSDYERYVRENIRFVIKNAKWGFGLSFYTGYAALAGVWADDFKNAILLGHTFDFFYKRIGLVLVNEFGFSEGLERDLILDETLWPARENMMHFSPSIHLGYMLKKGRLHAFPYLGVS